MNGKIFIDTGAWLAYSIPKEPDHQRISRVFNQSIKSHSLLYTSNDVIDETYTRFRYDSGWTYANKFIEYINLSLKTKTLTQLWTNDQIQTQAFNLLAKYADHKLSLTDATSAVLMTKLNIKTILTLDSTHFSALGFQVLP